MEMFNALWVAAAVVTVLAAIWAVEGLLVLPSRLRAFRARRDASRWEAREARLRRTHQYGQE